MNDEQCFYCGVLISGRVERDHFPVPRSCGGTNTVPSCISCHDMKDRFALDNWPADWLPILIRDFPLLSRESKLFWSKVTRVVLEANMRHDELITALAESSAWCARHQEENERLRRTLDDHLASESAETMRADRAEAEVRKLKKDYQALFDKVADERLDGYRELAARTANAENKLDDLRAKTRVRDARVEPPGDDVAYVLAWDGSYWFCSGVIEYMGREFDDSILGCLDPAPCEEYPYWLPMPPAPEEK